MVRVQHPRYARTVRAVRSVITDDRNRNFYQRVVLAPQPRTLQPDRESVRVKLLG
jgi:hypothetical protein